MKKPSFLRWLFGVDPPETPQEIEAQKRASKAFLRYSLRLIGLTFSGLFLLVAILKLLEFFLSL